MNTPRTPGKTRKPVIGITSDNSDSRSDYACPYAYCDAVSAAGGVPLVLPFRSGVEDVGQVIDLLDGIIFSGGNDLNPYTWGEEKHPKSAPINPTAKRTNAPSWPRSSAAASRPWASASAASS